MTLVDSSVWIGHLKRRNEQLVAALELGLVGSHPFVIGELALGSLGPRHQFVVDLGRLQSAPLARHEEVMSLVERERLGASGIGWVDAHLLASARLARMTLWTDDRRLAAVVSRLRLEPRFQQA